MLIPDYVGPEVPDEQCPVHFTKHALARMGADGITEELVKRVVAQPKAIVSEDIGRMDARKVRVAMGLYVVTQRKANGVLVITARKTQAQQSARR